MVRSKYVALQLLISTKNGHNPTILSIDGLCPTVMYMEL